MPPRGLSFWRWLRRGVARAFTTDYMWLFLFVAVIQLFPAVDASLILTRDNTWMQNLSPLQMLFIGGGMTIGGATLCCFGSQLQKKNSRGYWYSGLLIYILGNVIHMIALAFAPASVLSPMNSVSLFFSAIMGYFLHGETLGASGFFATALIVLGVGGCTVASVQPSQHRHAALEDKIGADLFSQPDGWYVIYLVALFFCVLVCFMLAAEEVARDDIRERLAASSPKRQASALARMEAQPFLSSAAPWEAAERPDDHYVTVVKKPDEFYHSREELLGDRGVRAHRVLARDIEDTEAPLEDGSGAENNSPLVIIETHLINVYSRNLGIYYGFISGMLGSQAVLEVKQIAAYVELGSQRPETWQTPSPYFSMFLIIMSAILQIHYCNIGMLRGESIVVLPCYYVSWCIWGTLGGFAKFHELKGFGEQQLALFAAGFVMIVIGVMLLSLRTTRAEFSEATALHDEQGEGTVAPSDKVATEESAMADGGMIAVGPPEDRFQAWTAATMGFGMLIAAAPKAKVAEELQNPTDVVLEITKLRRSRSLTDTADRHGDDVMKMTIRSRQRDPALVKTYEKLVRNHRLLHTMGPSSQIRFHSLTSSAQAQAARDAMSGHYLREGPLTSAMQQRDKDGLLQGGREASATNQQERGHKIPQLSDVMFGSQNP